MTDKLRIACETEIKAARAALAHADAGTAFVHLERAHILSQRHTFRHVRVHWLMLKLGASMNDWREVRGQMARIIAAALFSRIWIPMGNTGRANVSALKPMPIPDDLREILRQAGE